MARFLLLNPNTTAATTEAMLSIAREAAGPDVALVGETARRGAPVIADEAALAIAAAEVARMADAAPAGFDGLLVAAFGDPGLAAARVAVDVPVTGLAEAAIGDAAAGGRRFAIVTTTPALDAALRRKVAEHGATPAFAGLRYTRSGLAAMADPARLQAELLEACRDAERDGAAAIVIGGGPLAVAARALRGSLGVVLIEPLPAAVRLMLARCRLPGPAPSL